MTQNCAQDVGKSHTTCPDIRVTTHLPALWGTNVTHHGQAPLLHSLCFIGRLPRLELCSILEACLFKQDSSPGGWEGEAPARCCITPGPRAGLAAPRRGLSLNYRPLPPHGSVVLRNPFSTRTGAESQQIILLHYWWSTAF